MTMVPRFQSAYIFASALFLIALSSATTDADELYLKNGLRLNGTAFGIHALDKPYAPRDVKLEKELADAGIAFQDNPPMRVIDDGVRRYFVHNRQVVSLRQIDELARLVSFKLETRPSGKPVSPSQVGVFLSKTPFDEFGRRTVTLKTSRGKTPIIQAITELHPDTVTVNAISYQWKYQLDTKSIPSDVLRSLIRQASDENSESDRKAAVLFFIQANMFSEAERELVQLAIDFPELDEWSTKYREEIVKSKALIGLNEVQRRRDAGQHQLAWTIATKTPEEKVSVEVFRQAREIASEYKTALETRDRAIMLLDQLQAKLPVDVADQVKSIQAKLIGELHYENLSRLDAFLQSENDNTLTPQQKLALAYSGWLMGSEHASLDFNESLRLWEARYLMIDFLETDDDPIRDQDTLARLPQIEGINIERVSYMVPLLPLSRSINLPRAGDVQVVEVPTQSDDAPIRYSMMLPPEYSPHHRYPLMVVLKSEFQDWENAVRWWGGDASRPGWAQRRGYIVIAPHYCSDEETDHTYSSQSHEIVLESIQHLRKQVHVDSDRIFVSGHGMGGDATYDMAMSHPGVFAGAIPITAMIEKLSLFYDKNAPHMPWFIISGQKDRDSLKKNAGTLNRMMRKGYDVTYCEYKGRGFESYHEEQEQIFNWMEPLRRISTENASEFEAGSLRISDNHFHWMKGKSLPRRLYPPLSWTVPTRKVPRKFSGKITQGGTIYISHPGKSTTVWLSPALFDFQQRCHIRVNGQSAINKVLEPSISDLLNDVRERGDRERPYWIQLDL